MNRSGTACGILTVAAHPSTQINRFTIRIVVTFDYDPNERKFKLVKNR
ncbi:hypothetical protein [Kordia sp.]|nr:hypothetical protein [Kordia sp.]MCH2195376.1 hypothetical protein [Kordia sp.]